MAQDNERERPGEVPPVKEVAQRDLGEMTSDQLRRVKHALQILEKSEGWDLLAEWIDQRLKMFSAMLSQPAGRVADSRGGQGAWDGMLSKEFVSGEYTGTLQFQGLPQTLVEAVDEAIEIAEAREAEETGDDDEESPYET